MKTLLIFLAVSSTALAVTTVQFARRASTESARAEQESVQRQKQEARLRELELTVANQEKRLAAQARAAQVLAAAQAAPSPPAPAPETKAPNRVIAGTRREGGFAWMGPGGSGQAALQPGQPSAFRPWSSDAGQKYMRSQARGGIRRMYGDAPAELGLTEQQGKAFLDLLADQQTRNFGGRGDLPKDAASARTYMQDMQARNNAEIAAVIGQDKMTQWEAYQKTMPERSQVQVLAQQFDNSGTPLRDEQRRQLLDVMSQEQARHPRPALDQVEGLALEDRIAQNQRWQDEHDQAVFEQAKGILSSEQVEQYKAWREFQSELRKNAPLFRPAMGTVNGVVAAPGVTSVLSFGSSAPAETGAQK